MSRDRCPQIYRPYKRQATRALGHARCTHKQCGCTKSADGHTWGGGSRQGMPTWESASHRAHSGGTLAQGGTDPSRRACLGDQARPRFLPVPIQATGLPHRGSLGRATESLLLKTMCGQRSVRRSPGDPELPDQPSPGTREIDFLKCLFGPLAKDVLCFSAHPQIVFFFPCQKPFKMPFWTLSQFGVLCFSAHPQIIFFGLSNAIPRMYRCPTAF